MIKITQSNEEINSHGGNILVGAILNLKYFEKINLLHTNRIKHGQISHSDILKCSIALLAQGRTDFCNIELFKNDPLFKQSFNVKKVPSEETLRQRLNDLALCNTDQTLLDDCIVEMLKKVDDFGQIKTDNHKFLPLDIDVSVMLQPHCKKEGVSRTYHNKDGYAPIFCHIGTQGYMLANELREGKQHCSKDAIKFTARCIENAQKLGINKSDILLRVDSGHDDSKYIKYLFDSGVKFIMKRNLRSESREQLFALARSTGREISSREGKIIYRSIASHRHPKGLEDYPLFIIVEAEKRWFTANGERLLIPDIEVSTWWTNLTEDEDVCIDLYKDHATSEQYHSELKTDIGLESLPSGKFATNALFLNLATLAFNALRIIGQASLTHKELAPLTLNVNRRRLRTVLQDFIYLGCKFTRHANTTIVKFGRNCPWFKVFYEIYLTC